MVPLTPGGSNDLLARITAERLTARLGQPAIVDNKPGANGNIGTELVAKSAPDGHTLLMANTSHIVNFILSAKLPYDPIRDFAPVALMSSVHFALVVHPSVPAHSVQELIALARSGPGGLNYASAGNGSPHHLAMELFKSMAGVDLTHVPYKGAAQFTPDLVSGEVSAVIGAINSLLPHVKAGRLRVLAMAGGRRTPLLPDTPTIAEAALPGFALDNWGGMLVPAGTPRAIVERLNKELRALVDTDAVRQRIQAEGGDAMTSSPDEHARDIDLEETKWGTLIRKLNLKVE